MTSGNAPRDWEPEEYRMPEWGEGSMTAICWAMSQPCETALAKLILMRIADVSGMTAATAFYIGNMADWCCASAEDTAEAIESLGRQGALQVFLNDTVVDVALPWWRDPRPRFREEKPRFTKTDLRREKWDAQGGKCWYCGCDLSCDHLRTIDSEGKLVNPEGLAAFEIEHQIPRAQGGGDAKENLVLACKPCNRAKSDRTVDEYRAHLSARARVAVVFHGERSS